MNLIILCGVILFGIAGCQHESLKRNLQDTRGLIEHDCDGVSKYNYCVTVQFEGGRLGNQLFEIATVLSIAKDNNCKAVFPMLTKEYRWKSMTTYGVAPNKLFVDYLPEEENPPFSKKRLGEHRDESHLRCFEEHNTFAENISVPREDYGNLPLPTKIKTPSFLRMVRQHGSRTEGWGAFNFFSHKNFDRYRSDIWRTFGPTAEQRERLIKKFAGFGLDLRNKITVAIHIRRGDRVKGLSKIVHPPTTFNYVKEALPTIVNRLKERKQTVDHFVIFSDDPTYVHDELGKHFPDLLEQNKFFLVDFRKHNQKDYEDMWLMSLTTHQIISNSTFSWWGAYLCENPNKIVIEPKSWWLGPLNKFGIRYDTNGMSPPDWISLDAF